MLCWSDRWAVTRRAWYAWRQHHPLHYFALMVYTCLCAVNSDYFFSIPPHMRLSALPSYAGAGIGLRAGEDWPASYYLPRFHHSFLP